MGVEFMNAKIFFWIGAIFIIGSGSFYTLERVGQWFSLGTIQGGMASNSGSYATNEINVTLSDNQFVIPLLLAGIMFILIGIFLARKERK
jgi:hypothetical protein